MKVTELKFRITFTEPLLGTASGNREVHSEYIAVKAADAAKAEQEAAAIPLDEQIEKSSTIFPRDERGLFLWDYQIRGFFKEAIGVLVDLGDETTHGLSRYMLKRAVNCFLFVTPRKIYLRDPSGGIVTRHERMLQRPLRAETMQGPRVALASSELLPAGTQIEINLELLTGAAKTKAAVIREDTILAALNYGRLLGCGQWRTGSYGQFTFEQLQ